MQAKWFWFEQFRHGDVNSTAYQRQIIDTFVDSVYIFDDRVALNFNFKDTSKIVTREEVLGSADAGNGPPKQNPGPAAPGFVLRGHCRGASGSSPVLLRKRGAACGRNSRAGAGAAV